MKAIAAAATFFILGLLAASTPRYILPVCEFKGFPHMFCSDAALYEAWAGVGIMLVSVLIPFIKARPARVIFPLFMLAAGILVVSIPQITGFCKSPTMPCNYGAIPALRLIGGGTVVAALVFLFSSWRARPDED